MDLLGPVRQSASPISDASLAALLAGAKPPPGCEPQLHPLAQTLAELTGLPAGGELHGEAETLAAFRCQFAAFHGQPGRPGPAGRRHRRPRLPSTLLPVRAAIVASAAVLSLGGLAAVAYTGALPAPVQRLAHEFIAAPSPGSRSATKPSPATTRTGTSPSHRPRPVPTPHHSSKPSERPTPHGSGMPSAHPTPHGTGKPSGHPTPSGSGRPSSPPAQHGTGKPSRLPTPHSTGAPAIHPLSRTAQSTSHNQPFPEVTKRPV
ncbi:MAG TPA: hypothetical protein VKS82_09275 [Streptosporangiaceae bacterium]|nr:hypothetical protein [Streptosporangiaceae bacterium]